MWAKQSTAATLIVGPILDSAGAEYTSAVIGDLSISKNGGTLTALAAAATLTHIANGQYTLVMTTGNLDTLGRLQITCNKSTYQMPPIGLNIVPAMVFDSMVLGTDVLQSDVTEFGGTAGTFAAGIPTVVLDSSARVKLAADQPDYVPATASALATAYALLQLTDSDVASILSTVETIETNIGTPSGSLASMVADVPTVAEFEARTIASASYRQNITLRGTSITEAKAFDLLLAASAGVTSQPSGTTEKFKFLDGNDAFTTTFDTNGNRTGVALA